MIVINSCKFNFKLEFVFLRLLSVSRILSYFCSQLNSFFITLFYSLDDWWVMPNIEETICSSSFDSKSFCLSRSSLLQFLMPFRAFWLAERGLRLSCSIVFGQEGWSFFKNYLRGFFTSVSIQLSSSQSQSLSCINELILMGDEHLLPELFIVTFFLI